MTERTNWDAYLRLGSQPVATKYFKLAGIAVRDLVEDGGMGLLHGEAGVGKTFAFRQAIPGFDACTLQFAPRTTTKALTAALLSRTTGVEHEGTRARLETMLLENLRRVERLIVVDEAQNLNYECVEYLRHLYDDPETRFGLLLIGGNDCWELVQTYPMLCSRIYRRVEFQPLTIDELVRYLPRFHPMFELIDSETLEYVDDEYAHGRFRNWAAFTRTSERLMRANKIEHLDHDVIENAFALLGASGV